MIIFLAIVVIGIIVLLSNVDTGSESTTAKTTQTTRPSPPPAQVKPFSENTPDDIIKVIGLLAECVANKTDSSFYVVFENDNRTGDNRRIIINACLDDWGDRFKTQRGPNRWCWISPEGAAFLDTVPFTFDGDYVKYTYYTELNKPITYRNRGVNAVKQGIARARFANRHNIKIEESNASIDFYCL